MSDLPSPLPITLKAMPDIFPLTEAREDELRSRLVTVARSWIGTPYRQLGATKRIAVDCSMLLVRCIVEAGIVEDFDPRPYPPAWFIHQADERYIDWLDIVAMRTETPRAGDIVTFQVGRAFAHSGIMSDLPDHLIHAFANEEQVSESLLSTPALAWMRRGTTPRPRRFYDVFARLRQIITVP